MNIVLIVRKDRLNSKGYTSLVFKIQKSQKQFRKVTFTEKINPNLWNEKTGSVRKSHPESSFINQKINMSLMVIRKAIQKAELNGLDPLLESVNAYNVFIGKKEKEIEFNIDIFKLYECFLKDKEKDVKASTMRQIKQTKNVFADFCSEKYKPDIREINRNFEIDFKDYCYSYKEFSHNTYGKHLSRFKEFMKWSSDFLEDRDINIKQSFRNFKGRRERGNVDNLWLDELIKIQKAKLDNKKLERARDMFLGMVYYCMHYGDFFGLKHSDFEVRSDYLVVQRQKTGTTQIIPFFDDPVFKPKSLYEKYCVKDSEYVFPRISNQKMNQYLKEVQKEIGFNRFELTCKVGRKTFASIRYIEQKIDIKAVLSAGGWETEKNFLHYLGQNHRSSIDAFKNVNYDNLD